MSWTLHSVWYICRTSTVSIRLTIRQFVNSRACADIILCLNIICRVQAFYPLIQYSLWFSHEAKSSMHFTWCFYLNKTYNPCCRREISQIEGKNRDLFCLYHVLKWNFGNVLVWDLLFKTERNDIMYGLTTLRSFAKC